MGWLVSVAQALRCCSPALKDFLLSADDMVLYADPSEDEDEDEDEDLEERLRVQWADVMAGVSTCRELRVLVLPSCDEVVPLWSGVGDHAQEDPPDAGMMGLWELMASGGLPALAKLSVRLQDYRWGPAEVRARVAPACEAVAGTLTHLHIKWDWDWENGVPSDRSGVGYELGVAVGHLRRLKDLSLGLLDDGRAYHAFAQGLAASGGERPLPLLWRVVVDPDIDYNADLLASLVLSSVRVFSTGHDIDRQAFLAACALRRAGYKHTWTAYFDDYGGSIGTLPEQSRLVFMVKCTFFSGRSTTFRPCVLVIVGQNETGR
jgi:hypothetical protein